MSLKSTKSTSSSRAIERGEKTLSPRQRQELRLLSEHPDTPPEKFHQASLRVLTGAGLVSVDAGGHLALTATGQLALEAGRVRTELLSGELQAYGAGDGCISFTWAERLLKSGGAGRKGTAVSTGRPVLLGDLTPQVVQTALRGDDPQHWLVLDQGTQVKLVPVVSRVAADRLMYRGEVYRYEGWGQAFRAFVLDGDEEIEDRSGRRQVLANFVEIEASYAGMKPVSELLVA